jgi:hypothetical protein
MINIFNDIFGLPLFDLEKKILNSNKKYILDVLWGQPIKQNQVASTSELHENQRNDLLFFEIVPCHFCRASEVQT